MTNKSSQKSGIFSWFRGKKRKTNDTAADLETGSENSDTESVEIQESHAENFLIEDNLASDQPVKQEVVVNHLVSTDTTEFHPEANTPETEETESPVTETLVPLDQSIETKADSDIKSEPVMETDTKTVEAPPSKVVEDEINSPPAQLDIEKEPAKQSFFRRLKNGLAKTRSQFSSGFAALLLGKKEIDEDIFEEMETILLMADVGVDTTNQIIDDLTARAKRKELKDTKALIDKLKSLLFEIIEPVQVPLVIPSSDQPFVILMVGVNGVGKTTTIGKMAHQFIADGKSVMLAAGDTFRAAAVEQLKAWGEQNNVPVVAQHTGADSASVIFDAVERARARNIDIIIADTAGRLHNKRNLMDELSKIERVIGKIDKSAPHEVMLVVDAGTGQNALVQAVEFNKIVKLHSVTITKLDGTAKGGIIFSLANKMKIPIRYIGVGEAKEDLRSFNAKDFIDALFN